MEPIACATCFGSGVTLDGKDCWCGSRSFLRVDSNLVQMIQGNNDEITKLRAELAEAKKDAERYRWMRQYFTHETAVVQSVVMANTPAMLDVAIDYEMEKS